MSIDEDIDIFLSHYGVKGMQWGVINEDERAGLASKFKSFSDKQKYGSMNDKEEKIEDQGFFKSLTPSQKKAAVIFGGTVVVAGLAYGAHRYGANTKGLVDPRSLLDGRDPFDGIGGAHREGLLAYKDRRITLPSGSLVARVSKDIETNIRPDGFYAAHEKHDVDSYVGFLGSIGGHVNYFKANSEIRAPSTREYIDSLSRAMDHPEVLKARNVNTKILSKLSPLERTKVLNRLAAEELAKRDFAFSLNSSSADGLLPKRFVEDIRKSGFNAVVDYNNASPSVAQAPLRHLDGSIFKLFHSEPITAEVKQLSKINQDAYMDKIEAFYDNLVHSLYLLLTYGRPHSDVELKHCEELAKEFITYFFGENL